MSVVQIPTKPTRPVGRKLFTKDEYYRMHEAGVLGTDRVELIGGEIVYLAAQTNWHAIVLHAARTILEAAFGPDYWVRVQNSLDLTPMSVPDPDIAVIPGSYLEHAKRMERENPTHALLALEVSDTTLASDRVRKASLYASAGITDYWVLNIADWQLEVRRDPRPDATQDFGFGYASLTTLRPGDTVFALALPNIVIAVSDLLPGQ